MGLDNLDGYVMVQTKKRRSFDYWNEIENSSNDDSIYELLQLFWIGLRKLFIEEMTFFFIALFTVLSTILDYLPHCHQIQLPYLTIRSSISITTSGSTYHNR